MISGLLILSGQQVKGNPQLQSILVYSGILGVFKTQSGYTRGNLSMHM